MIPRLLRYRKREGASLLDKITASLVAEKRPKRILFVEDDEHFQEIFLRHVGPTFEVEIESAHSTGEARAILERSEHFDAALLDVRVTNGDGVWLYDFITRRWPSIEVVFLTGYDSENLRQRIEKIGPARVFSKDRLLNQGFLRQLFDNLGVTLKTT